MQCPALQGNARHRKSKQRGSELGNRLFSGPLWPDGNAWQGNAMQSTELRFKATRIGAWQQAPFRAALARAHSGAWKRTDLHGSARHISALQSNADRSLATGSFPGRFGPKAERGNARQITDPQGSAVQSNADWSLATGFLPGRFGSSALCGDELQRSAYHGIAQHRNAEHSTAKQRGSPTGNSGFSGLFCPSGRVSPAALSTD